MIDIDKFVHKRGMKEIIVKIGISSAYWKAWQGERYRIVISTTSIACKEATVGS